MTKIKDVPTKLLVQLFAEKRDEKHVVKKYRIDLFDTNRRKFCENNITSRLNSDGQKVIFIHINASFSDIEALCKERINTFA